MTTTDLGETRPTTPPTSRRRREMGAAPGFWATGAAFAVMMAFTTVPTPLYALYQARDGFPTAVVTAIFASYAAGVIVSLYLVGHVSDAVGRRPVMLAAVVLALVAAVMFLAWSTVAGLLVARFVSGLGVGALTATATAYLTDLRLAARPDSPHLAATVGGVANLGGLSLGPLVAGALAEWAPHPLVLPYAVLLVAIVAAGVVLAFVPETVARRPFVWHPQRVAVPDEHRAVFWAAGAAAFAAFAITGFFGSVAPAFLTRVLGSTDRLVAGLTAFSVFAASALSQVVFARLPLRRQLAAGTAGMALGLLAIAAAGPLASMPALLGGGIVAGAGVGLVFRGALATAGGLAGPGNRGAVLAGVFLLAYAGMSVPPLLVGVALLRAPIVPTTVVFAVLVLALVVWAGTLMTRRATSRP